MGNLQDSRLLELKRLQVALEAARERLDQFEARAFRRRPEARWRPEPANSRMPAENTIAQHIAVGLAKLRHGH